MTAAVVTTVGVLATAAVTLITFLIRRNDKSKDPVARSSAEVALAKEALGIIESSRDALKEDVARLIEAREQDRIRLDAVEVELRAVREGWMGWYRDLKDHWAHHRQQPRPPHPPDLS